MALHHKTGKDGEDSAVKMLEENGYTILERNWRFKRGELDIIAQLGNRIIFIEVKARSSEKYGNAEYAVDTAKQKLIAATAEAYLYTHNLTNEIRFDVITVVPHNGDQVIQHFEDAFFPNPTDEI